MYKNIRLIRNLFLYFAINILINLGKTELCDECITPNPENKAGWCVQAKYCPMIGNIVGLPLKRYSAKYQIFIKNSKCSSHGSHYYCCARGLINPKFFKERTKICNTKFTPIDYQTSKISSTTKPTEVLQKPNIFNRGINSVDLDNHPNLKLLSENENCGLSSDGDKIAYGSMTDIDEFPFMALLQYKRNETDVFKCGGTLINKNYVLTAAHCILPNLFSVRLGEHNIDKDRDCETGENPQCNEPVQDIPIGEIHKAKYDPITKINDVALLRLKRPVDATANNIGFVCLPTTAELRKKQIRRANIAGWGLTENRVAAKILLKGTVNVNEERQNCINSYEPAGVNINENFLCAIGTRIGSKTVDTCMGDSGGPLLDRSVIPGEANERFIQYGIVATGPGIPCGKTYDTGGAIYTNVSTHMKWILDNIRS